MTPEEFNRQEGEIEVIYTMIPPFQIELEQQKKYFFLVELIFAKRKFNGVLN